MYWIALAAQLSSPQPLGYKIWFSADDFPTYVVAEGQTKRVTVRAVVRPDGSLQGCGVESSSGDRKLDQWTCVLVAKRARYTPARWTDGSAVFGVHRMPVVWTVGSAPPEGTSPGDLELTVAKLPPDVRSPARVAVMFSADEKGQPVSCTEATRDLIPAMQPIPVLVPTACEQLVKNFRAIPPQDDAGKAVRSVQNADVKFTVSK